MGRRLRNLPCSALGNRELEKVILATEKTTWARTAEGSGHLAGSEDAFVTKFDTGGALVYPTYLGGMDQKTQLALLLRREGMDMSQATPEVAQTSQQQIVPIKLPRGGPFPSSWCNRLITTVCPAPEESDVKCIASNRAF